MFCGCGKDDVAIQPPQQMNKQARRIPQAPQEPPLEVKTGLATTNYRIGMALAEEGKLKEALACFKDAIQLDPTHVDAHYMLATTYQEINQHHESLKCYQKTIRLQPTHYAAWYNLGYLYQDLGSTPEYREKAIRCFRKATELEPKDVDSHINLGLSLKAAGRVSEAIVAYSKAIELDKSCICAYFNLGNLYSDMRNLDKAISSFKSGLEANSSSSTPHTDSLFNLAIALQDRSCTASDALARQRDIRESIKCYLLVATPEASMAASQLQILLQAESTERKLVDRVKGHASIAPSQPQSASSMSQQSPRRPLQSLTIRPVLSNILPSPHIGPTKPLHLSHSKLTPTRQQAFLRSMDDVSVVSGLDDRVGRL